MTLYEVCALTAHHDEVDVALVTERADKLRVLGVLAVLGQAAKAGRPAVKRLGAPAYSGA